MQNRAICAVSIRISMKNTAGNSRNRYRRSRSGYTAPERLTDTKPPEQVKSNRPPNRYQKQRRQNTAADRDPEQIPRYISRPIPPERSTTTAPGIHGRSSPQRSGRARWIFRARYGAGDDRRTWSSSNRAGTISFCAFCNLKKFSFCPPTAARLRSFCANFRELHQITVWRNSLKHQKPRICVDFDSYAVLLL